MYACSVQGFVFPDTSSNPISILKNRRYLLAGVFSLLEQWIEIGQMLKSFPRNLESLASRPDMFPTLC